MGQRLRLAILSVKEVANLSPSCVRCLKTTKLFARQKKKVCRMFATDQKERKGTKSWKEHGLVRDITGKSKDLRSGRRRIPTAIRHRSAFHPDQRPDNVMSL